MRITCAQPCQRGHGLPLGISAIAPWAHEGCDPTHGLPYNACHMFLRPSSGRQQCELLDPRYLHHPSLAYLPCRLEQHFKSGTSPYQRSTLGHVRCQVISPIFAYGIMVRHMLFVNVYMCLMGRPLCRGVGGAFSRERNACTWHVPASINFD